MLQTLDIKAVLFLLSLLKCLIDFVERDSRFICSQCQSDRKTAVQERDEQEKTRRGDWSIFKIDCKKMLCILDTKRNKYMYNINHIS